MQLTLVHLLCVSTMASTLHASNQGLALPARGRAQRRRPECHDDPRRVVVANPCAMSNSSSTSKFEEIYVTSAWGGDAQTRSGPGSTLCGAWDWIQALAHFLPDHNITTVADVPSGDCGWQFAVHGLNAAVAYIGGDVSQYAVEHNVARFGSHLNKAFVQWDVALCGAPRWRYAHEAHDTGRAVELVMLRDVVQHMDIASSMSAIKKIVLESGATFLATSSYTNAANWTCTNPCKNISAGGFYANDFACPPFSFPPPLLVVPSHGTGPCRNHENDVLAIWRIDTLTSHAKGMYAACP